jgi:hypothetical protein
LVPEVPFTPLVPFVPLVPDVPRVPLVPELPVVPVNKFKTCALSAFCCNYTPEGIWAAYEAGQPVSTVFSMSFSELEPIYDTDYQEGNIFSGFENDLSSISNDSVGY